MSVTAITNCLIIFKTTAALYWKGAYGSYSFDVNGQKTRCETRKRRHYVVRDAVYFCFDFTGINNDAQYLPFNIMVGALHDH